MAPWLPRNSRALKTESINHSKLPQASSGRSSRKLPHGKATSPARRWPHTHTRAWFPKRRPGSETGKQNVSVTLESNRGQTRRDRERTEKWGGGGPIIPRMPTTRNRKETMHSLTFHKLGQRKVGILKERPQEKGSRQVKSQGWLRL